MTSRWHERNATTSHRFPVKVTKIPVSCSPLPGMKSIMLISTWMSTIICILILICMTTQHSKSGNKPPHLFSIYSLHAQWNKGEHEKKVQTEPFSLFHHGVLIWFECFPWWYIALVRWPPWELNISCTSTIAESRARIWCQWDAFGPPGGLGCCPF